jgi:hypothetical protein
MASVATMTGTLIDSGCKHIIPVRVSMDTHLALMKDPDQNTLLREKMSYCAHKSDLLLCVNKPLFSGNTGASKKGTAYPNVIATLGDAPPKVLELIAAFYHYCDGHGIQQDNGSFNAVAFDTLCNTEGVYRHGTNEAERNTRQKDFAAFQKMPYFSFMGFSLGLGYAHPTSGDTVVSSMIGGMISVRNGHFPVCTGDQIMWYFECEVPYFDGEGRRKDDMNNWKLQPDEELRRKTHRRQNGNFEAGELPAQSGKKNIAYPKPYLPVRRGTGGFLPGGLDKMRVFAKAVANARPFDMVDLQICTQSI